MACSSEHGYGIPSFDMKGGEGKLDIELMTSSSVVLWERGLLWLFSWGAEDVETLPLSLFLNRGESKEEAKTEREGGQRFQTDKTTIAYFPREEKTNSPRLTQRRDRREKRTFQLYLARIVTPKH